MFNGALTTLMPELDRAVLLPVGAAGVLALVWASVLSVWVLRQPDVIAIPKASDKQHVSDNARSSNIKLTKDDLAELDKKFPPPKSKKPLPML